MSEDTPTNDADSGTFDIRSLPVERRRYLKYAGATLGGSLSAGTASAANSENGHGGTQDGKSLNLRPTDLRVEYEKTPNNIEPGDSVPRLSWQIAHDGHGACQAAYRIIVGVSKDALAHRKDLVWDSEKVVSSQSTAVPYKGPSLDSNETYYWAVRIWDAHGNASRWSKPSSFGTAIRADQWEATWIGKKEQQPTPLSLSDASWIWYPEGNPQEQALGATRYFRYSFNLDDTAIENARFALLVDGESEVYLNGETIVEAGGFETATVFNLRSSYQLQAGTNTLAVEVTNEEGPAGLLAHLRVQYENGETSFVNTGDEWLASKEVSEGWQTQGFDDSSWVSAKVLGNYGVDPWGEAKIPSLTDVSQSPLVRTEIELEKPVESARAHVVTLGYGNLYVNGTCFGQTALKPWTEFDDRVLYETRDVTDTLSSGSNAVGLWLGRGWFSQGISNWPSYGVPRGLVQLHITFEDGETRTVTSDPSWRTTRSPVHTNDVYDGETYDARAERPGWATPSYDASNWENVDELPAPEDALSKEQDEDWEEQFELEPRHVQPRESVKILEPESVMEQEDGYIVDFGQNHAGWVELAISGTDAGDEIVIKHAEILTNRGARGEDDPDDVVVDDWEMLPDTDTVDIYTGTTRAADQTDVYIANGSGTEVYEPRFTYHGFRYAKVIGYPGELTADDIRSNVVNTGFEKSGSFDVSSEDLQRVQENSIWGQRSVSQSLPLDNPQRDERMGWTGDAHMSVRSQLFNFDAYRMFAKYMDDHDANQSPEGTQTDTIPHAYGGRPADPNWARTRVTIPWFMYLHSGDTRVLSERYEGMKLYVDYWNRVAENHIVPAEANHYGDWLAPREPEINNDLALLNTFAHYQTTDFLAQIADVLGKTEDAQRYRDRARAIADAFNREFFDPRTNSYGSGDMTTYALPLYTGIVPDDREDEVAEGLVTTIWEEYDGKIGTGFVGTRPLLFTLVEHGYISTAYHIVSQPEEPGWVFIARNGATTQWERWDAPDYPPDLNSLNHRNWTLISEWFYRVLAGINAAEPGFKRIDITPHVVEDLDHAGGEVETVRGTIASRWQRTKNGLRLSVSIPANSTASVAVPTDGTDPVRLTAGDATLWTDGAATKDLPAGIENVTRDGQRIDVQVTAGDYEFTKIRHP